MPSAWSSCILAVILAAAAQTSPVAAREFRVADNQSADYREMIITEFPRRPFEEAMASIYAKAMNDPALARLIERIRLIK